MVGCCLVKMDDRVVVVVIVGNGDWSVGSFFWAMFRMDCVKFMLISGMALVGVLPVLVDKSRAWLFPKKSSSENDKINN